MKRTEAQMAPLGPYWRHPDREKVVMHLAAVKANEALRDFAYDPTFTERSKSALFLDDDTGLIYEVKVTISARSA